MSDAQSSFIYVSYIRTTPEKLWAALTLPEFTKLYWFGVSMQSEWKAGSPWKMTYEDGRVTDAGEILEADPPRRLVIKWRDEMRPDLTAEGYSRCTMELQAMGELVKLSILHEIDVPKAKLIEAVSGGWPMIISNLKSLLETGAATMPAKP